MIMFEIYVKIYLFLFCIFSICKYIVSYLSLNDMQAMFTIPEGQSFWQSFSDQVVHFKELTKDMSEEKVFSLMSDPACPGKYINS